MAKRRITQTTPHDSPWDSSFLTSKISAKFERDHPLRGLNAGWVGQIGDFRQITDGYISTRSSAIAKGPRDASCQLKSCQLPRNSTETTCTTSLEQIEVMKLEGYSGPMCNKHVHGASASNVRMLKFSVHIRPWILANGPRPQQNCNLGAAVSQRPQRL